jgi:hypothetical protein
MSACSFFMGFAVLQEVEIELEGTEDTTSGKSFRVFTCVKKITPLILKHPVLMFGSFRLFQRLLLISYIH